eukprot:6546179-Prymnesium_polylepis.1
MRDQDELLLESDADEQLLITVVFKSQVRLHSLLLAAPEDGRGPKKLKFFANRDNLDFESAEDAKADHELDFDDSSSYGQRLELGRGFVKFQKLQKLVIFVASNLGDEDSTAISTLKLWGAADASTNSAPPRPHTRARPHAAARARRAACGHLNRRGVSFSRLSFRSEGF